MNDVQYIPITLQKSDVYLLRLDAERSAEGMVIASIEPFNEVPIREECLEEDILV